MFQSRWWVQAMGQVHFKQATDIYNSGGDVGEFTYKVVKGIIAFLLFIPLLICAIFGNGSLGFFWVLTGEWQANIAQIRSFELLFVSMMVSVFLHTCGSQKTAIWY